MLSLFMNIKSKLVALSAAAIGIMLLYISHLRNKSLETELKQKESEYKYKNRANEALNIGVGDEAKKSIDRKHDFTE